MFTKNVLVHSICDFKMSSVEELIIHCVCNVFVSCFLLLIRLSLLYEVKQNSERNRDRLSLIKYLYACIFLSKTTFRLDKGINALFILYNHILSWMIVFAIRRCNWNCFVSVHSVSLSWVWFGLVWFSCVSFALLCFALWNMRVRKWQMLSMLVKKLKTYQAKLIIVYFK